MEINIFYICLDIVIELFSFLGGDGIQPADIRPFSFRSIAIVEFGMLVTIMDCSLISNRFG